jgi:hypothetical protein
MSESTEDDEELPK